MNKYSILIIKIPQGLAFFNRRVYHRVYIFVFDVTKKEHIDERKDQSLH